MEKKNKEVKKTKAVRKRKAKLPSTNVEQNLHATPTATFHPSPTPCAVSDQEHSNTHAILNKLNKWLQDNSLTSPAELTRKRNIENMDDYITLEQTVTEFLDTFLLIGYNLEGQRVMIQHTRNNRDQDALIELLRNIAVMPIKPPSEDDMM
jgi:hypothetical protein